MELFMKGRMFAHLDTVAVTDAAGREVYSLKNNGSGLRHRIAMTGPDGTLLACIEQQPAGKTSRFVVTMADGRQAATVEKKPTVKPAYSVTGPGWEVSGSLFSTKYTVTKGGKTVAVLKVSTLKSEISIDDGEDPIFAAAVVMAIRIALYYNQVAGTMATVAVLNG